MTDTGAATDYGRRREVATCHDDQRDAIDFAIGAHFLKTVYLVLHGKRMIVLQECFPVDAVCRATKSAAACSLPSLCRSTLYRMEKLFVQPIGHAHFLEGKIEPGFVRRDRNPA